MFENMKFNDWVTLIGCSAPFIMVAVFFGIAIFNTIRIMHAEHKAALQPAPRRGRWVRPE